jgi:hypothetical protein
MHMIVIRQISGRHLSQLQNLSSFSSETVITGPFTLIHSNFIYPSWKKKKLKQVCPALSGAIQPCRSPGLMPPAFYFLAIHNKCGFWNRYSCWRCWNIRTYLWQLLKPQSWKRSAFLLRDNIISVLRSLQNVNVWNFNNANCRWMSPFYFCSIELCIIITKTRHFETPSIFCGHSFKKRAEIYLYIWIKYKPLRQVKKIYEI